VQAVVVKKALPVKSMAELVAYAKANPGKLNFGQRRRRSDALLGRAVPGPHGTHMVHIPFKGARRRWRPCCPATSICLSPT
jgi:tripartite-type tricarboxylate transporter receptor subunit TctC